MHFSEIIKQPWFLKSIKIQRMYMYGDSFPNLRSIISEKYIYPQFSLWILIALAKICFFHSHKTAQMYCCLSGQIP